MDATKTTAGKPAQRSKPELSNAVRFINAYNKIESALKNIYNLNAAMSFTDVIRTCAKYSNVVQSAESILVDYARLRNAIVHKSTEEIVIAEPHLSAVEDFERLARLISTPPTALDLFGRRKVLTLPEGAKIGYAIKFMRDSHFSNIPVYGADGVLKGIVNNKMIVLGIAEAVANEQNIDAYLRKTPVGSLLCETYFDRYYSLCGEDVSLDKVLHMFTANRKMVALLITKRGTRLERPISIITAYDIVDINAVMEDY